MYMYDIMKKLKLKTRSALHVRALHVRAFHAMPCMSNHEVRCGAHANFTPMHDNGEMKNIYLS